MTPIRYRADIDGLRAVAVLPVVMFHLGFAWMPGGFVGVDVFFVISGYLITSIIARELDEDRFSLLRFYERRIRRIFPALFFVIGTVLVVATMLFVPDDLNDLGKSVAAATVFLSNLFFYAQTGYFDASAYTKLLLHSWSLAIEEQFYLGLPLLMMLLAAGRASRWLNMGFWVALLTLLSFLLSALTTNRYPSEAYYLLPWRAWELGIGAMLALDMAPRLRRALARHLAGIVGFCLILAAALMIDKTTRFPGVAALAPVMGAALIIQAGRDGSNMIGTLLSARLPVWIGKLSYSLYLWHWPLIVFFVYWTFELPGPGAAILLFLASIVMAWVSWRFVEQPFRHPGRTARRSRLFAGAGLVAGCTAVFGVALAVLDGIPGRLTPEALAIARFDIDRDSQYRECFRQKMQEKTWLDPCIFGADPEGGMPVRVALWSDSHGPSYLPGLEIAARKWQQRIAFYGHDGCPGIDGLEVFWIGSDHSCAGFLGDTFAALRDHPQIELVIYALRAPLYAQGWVDYGFVERDRKALLIGDISGPLGANVDRTEFFLTGLETTIEALLGAGKSVALIYPLPEAGTQVPGSLVRYHVRGQAAEDLTLPREVFERRSGPLIAGFDRISKRHGLYAVRPHDLFCDESLCRLTLEGMPIFSDGNHLSPPVSEKLAPLFDPLFATLSTTPEVARTLSD
ncbi:acyltransferase family protein [Sulfitobacter aestuarii]|uniref:Acyltransferase family protein n=1 Tax=Sulfitobacter aestuarii TaxID=2161676 RepID=A0ABW5U2F3_9RHOB